jgi:membrane-bound serine protease (ClpP class)
VTNRRTRAGEIGWLALVLLAVLASGDAQATPRVNLATVNGSINPASADYLIAAIEKSEQDGAAALLIEMDTPGGLVSSTKDIIQAMLNAEVPIIVYVAPRGAWAASAGTFITVAANVAAMAPGTSIGAAHPVPAVGGSPPTQEGGGDEKAPASDMGMQKAENLLAAYMETIAKKRDRNVEWVVEAVRTSVAIGEDEALEIGVIDVIAENRAELLAALDGRVIEIGDGSEVTLALADARVEPLEMTTVQGLFNFLSSPNVAVLLLMGGMLGLYVEFNNPGMVFPGVAGGVCLLLAGIAFQYIPFSWVGLILMLLGLALFVAEIFLPTYGILFACGIGAFLLGGTLVFDRPELSDLTVSFWQVLLPSVVAMSICVGVVVFAVGRSMLSEQTAGVDELIGLVGRSTTTLDPNGTVFVRGEFWSVDRDDVDTAPIEPGEAVEVTAVEGMRLRVRRAQRNT